MNLYKKILYSFNYLFFNLPTNFQLMLLTVKIAEKIDWLYFKKYLLY